MSTAAELLDALPRHFGSVAPTLPAAQRAMSFASDLLRLSEDQRWSGVRSSSPDLKQQLLASARVLSDFATAAARGADTDYLPAALVTHILASVKAIASCALLAGTLEQLDPQAAFAVCAPCSLVFGTGSAMLAPMVQSQSPQAAFHLCEVQLAAAAVAVGDLLLPLRQPRAAAAFANSTARPQALVAWLGELCRALLSLQDDIEPGGRKAVSTSLVALLHTLLTAEPYARHRDALAASPALQQAVADAVLAYGLGGLPTLLGPDGSQVRAGADALECLPAVLRHPVLAAAVVQLLHTADAVAATRDVAAVIEALPVQRPASMPASLFVNAHSDALLLLSICCQRQVCRLSADGALVLEFEVVRGSSTISSSSGGSACTGSGGSGGRGGTEGPSSSDYRPMSAWQLVALVPRLAAAVQALADDPDGPAALLAGRWLAVLDAACNNIASALFLPAVLERQPASADQLASWVAAATAGLRLQPLLLQLDSKFQQMQREPGDTRPVAEGARRLSAMVVMRLWRDMLACELLPPAATSREEPAQLAASLAELHSAACRLAHFMVGRGSAALAGTQLDAPPIGCWAEKLALLTAVFQRMMRARLGCSISPGAAVADPEGDNAPLDLHGACAAHLHAVLAMAGAAAGEEGAAENVQWPGVLRRGLAEAVQHCSRYIDSAWVRAMDEAFEHLALHAAEVSGPLELATELLCPLAEAAAIRPRLAAALASGGLLGRMLQVAGQLLNSPEDGATASAVRLLAGWEAAVLEMAADGQQGGVSAAQHGVTGSMLAEVQAAAGALLKQRQLLLGELSPSASLAERAERLQQLAQPASRLGRAMVEMAHSPAMEAQRQLELARAAATRSCAYLRCANVAGQGGAAAGQGVGSARCSACRAVWYCGTACSHADWRAGHKRVCKALAAERQAAKATKTAAAEPGAAQ